MKKNLIFAIVLIVIIVGLSVYFMVRPQVHYLQGQVEASQTIVAPLVPGRVAQFYVEEGDTIQKGDLIVMIETPIIDAKMIQAQAVRDAAQSQLQKANAGARVQKIQAAYNQWQMAKAAATLAEKTYKRVENLYKEKVVAEQKRDEAYTQFTARKEQADAAKAIYDMAKQGAREEDKKAAAALVKQASGVVEEVGVYKKEAKVYAPNNGVVQELILEQGEVSGAGTPLATIVDLSDMWVVINVREDKLSHFSVGKTFKGMVPALNNKTIEWKVKNIAVMGDFATWTATRASGDFDKKTFKVKAYPAKPIKGLRPGMSVLVKE